MALVDEDTTGKYDGFLTLARKACYYRRFSGVTF
jgi:hypothetical protein